MGNVFFLKGLVIGVVIAAPLGPIGILSTRRILMHGRRAGFFSGMGAASADAIYAFIAAFGLSFASAFLTGHQFWLRLAGGAVLCALGVQVWAARSQFINGIMRGFGVEGVIDPAQMQRLTTPVAFPRYVGRNWMEGLGSFLSGAAPYLGGSGQHGASGAGGSGAYPSFSGDLPEGSDPGFNYGTGRRPPSTSTDNPQDIYDLFENL